MFLKCPIYGVFTLLLNAFFASDGIFNACIVKLVWHDIVVFVMAVNVLFVFKGSRRELLVLPGRSVCNLLTEELKKTGNDTTVRVGKLYEPPGNASTTVVRKMASIP